MKSMMKGVSLQKPGTTPVTFQEVAGSFSAEEWKLLDQWQMEIYTNVMKEIHQALISLGPAIAASVFSLKAKEKGSVSPVEDSNFDGRQSTNHSPRYPYFIDDSFSRMEEKPATILNEDIHAEVDERNMSPSLVVSFPIKEEEDTYSREHQFHRRTDDISRYEGSYRNKTNEKFENVLLPKEKQSKEKPPKLDDGSMNTEMEARDSALCTEQATEVKRIPGNIEVKRSHSRSQMWPDNNTEMAGECTAQFERGFCYQGTSQSDGSENYEKYENNLSQANVLTFQPNTEITCQSHPCYEAEKTFPLKHHHRQESTNTIEMLSNLNECGRSATWKASLIEDKEARTGHRVYHCTECEKSFKHKVNLIEHQRNHTGQRPYQCNDCGKGFVRRRTLTAHQRTHTGERPYQCTGCAKCFSLKHNLKTHQRTCRHFL